MSAGKEDDWAGEGERRRRQQIGGVDRASGENWQGGTGIGMGVGHSRGESGWGTNREGDSVGWR